MGTWMLSVLSGSTDTGAKSQTAFQNETRSWKQEECWRLLEIKPLVGKALNNSDTFNKRVGGSRPVGQVHKWWQGDHSECKFDRFRQC